MPCNPAYISGLTVWLKADAIVGLVDTDPVATWDDESGNNLDATQSTAGFKPLYRTGIINGLPALSFDGTDDVLSLGNLAAFFPTAATLFIVADISDAGYSLVDTSNVDSYWRFSGDGNGYLGVFRTARIDGYPMAMPNTGAHLFTVQSGSAYEVFLDGTSKGTQSGSYSAGNSYLIGRDNTATAEKVLSGYVAEILIYNRGLSSVERGHVNQYVSDKYALTIADMVPCAAFPHNMGRRLKVGSGMSRSDSAT